MTIPDFETTAGLADCYSDFMMAFTPQDLYAIAETVVREVSPESGVHSFRDHDGGLMGLTIGLILTEKFGPNEIDSVRDHLLELYDFDAESLPPRMLIREMVALAVRSKQVEHSLLQALGQPSIAGSVLRQDAIHLFQLTSPEMAYLLTDEQVDQLWEEL